MHQWVISIGIDVTGKKSDVDRVKAKQVCCVATRQGDRVLDGRLCGLPAANRNKN